MKNVPADYYERLRTVEERHWWHTGMLEITGALLGDRLAEGRLSLLDAGCGTGGFLAWASRTGAFDRLCGIDLSPEAVDLARAAVPGAVLHLAPVGSIPFADASFDLVALNDVLQHVDERAVAASLGELRRVLKEGGALVVRTNGGCSARRERKDWRLYDERLLRQQLEGAGFHVERLTHANGFLSAWATIRGKAPTAPTGTTCGIPSSPGALVNTIGSSLLGLEARYLRSPGRRLGFGHTLLAVATPGSAATRGVQAFFDATSSEYDRGYASGGSKGRVLRRRAEVAARMLGDRPGDVLDAGMGGGVLLAELDRLGWRVTGIDIAPAMVARARERMPHAADRLLQASIDELPFAHGSFDAVVVTGVLEYAAHDLDGAVSELARVLRPGGALVASFPNYGALATRWRAHVHYPLVRFAKKLLRSRRPAPLRMPLVPFSQFRTVLEQHGLGIETVELVERVQYVVRARQA